MNTKIYTYVGFAIKAGKAKLGVGSIEFTKGRIPLMILCDTASENTKKDAKSLARKHSSKLLLVKNTTVEELTNKSHCKLAGILDESLVKAIINETLNDNDYLFLEA